MASIRALFSLGTAVAALCSSTGTAAQSSVQLYGTIDMGVASRQLSGERRTAQLLNGAVTTSFWGLRGSEDLGDGLRAFFVLESFFRGDTGEVGRSGADPYWARASFVGLSGSYGAVRMGRVVTPSFIASGRFSPLGPAAGIGPLMMHTFVASAAQPMLTGSSGSDSTWNNALSYTSPTWNGLSVTAIAALGEGGSAGKRNGLTANWESGAFAATLNYERLSNMTQTWGAPVAPLATLARPLFTAADAKIGLAGASYDFGVAKLFSVAYQSELTSTARAKATLRTSQIGASVPWGQGAVLVSWAHTRKVQPAMADVSRDTTTAGYMYRLSKRTDLYALVTRDKVSTLSSGTSTMAGVRHSF